MAKNTSILLGDYFDDFVSSEVSSGRYSSSSEVIRTALRLLEVEEIKRQELRKALIIGERSGWQVDFEPAKFLRGLRRRRR